MARLSIVELSSELVHAGLGRERHESSQVEHATPQQLRSTFDILALHRLELLGYRGLQLRGVEHHLDPDARALLEAAHAAACRKEALLQLTFVRVSNLLHEAGVDVIGCKGIVLGKDYYPERGLRVMKDIDLWIGKGSPEDASEVLKQNGFTESEDKRTANARYFKSPLGVILDVHHRMALFEHTKQSLHDLSSTSENGSYRKFIPEALIVHLVAHLLSHSAIVGILLGWVLDVALVVDKHGATMDFDRVKRLCPEPHVYNVLIRLLALSAQLGWCQAIPSLEEEVSSARPLSYEKINQLRRLAPWNLTRPKGVMRWMYHLVSDGPRADMPSPGEVLVGYASLVSEQVHWFDKKSGLLGRDHSHR